MASENQGLKNWTMNLYRPGPFRKRKANNDFTIGKLITETIFTCKTLKWQELIVSDDIIGCPYTLARYHHVFCNSFSFAVFMVSWIFCTILSKLHPCAVPLFTKCLNKNKQRQRQRQPPLPSRFVPAPAISYWIQTIAFIKWLFLSIKRPMFLRRHPIEWYLVGAQPSTSSGQADHFQTAMGKIISSFWANIPNWYDTNNTTNFIDVWVTFQASTFHVSSDYHSEHCVWSQTCKM